MDYFAFEQFSLSIVYNFPSCRVLPACTLASTVLSAVIHALIIRFRADEVRDGLREFGRIGCQARGAHAGIVESPWFAGIRCRSHAAIGGLLGTERWARGPLSDTPLRA